jgi:hypothetical protein
LLWFTRQIRRTASETDDLAKQTVLVRTNGHFMSFTQ